MTSLATNLNDGGSVAIHIVAVAAGGIAGYVVGRVARSAFEDATSWATQAIANAKDLLSLDLELDLGNLDFLGPGGI